MIYLNNTTAAQVAYVPRDVDAVGTLRFTLRSTIDLDTVVDAVVLDLKIHQRYYGVAVQLPADAPTGEYEYTFTAGGVVVSTGVVFVSEPDAFEEYKKSIQYEQYTDQ